MDNFHIYIFIYSTMAKGFYRVFFFKKYTRLFHGEAYLPLKPRPRPRPPRPPEKPRPLFRSGPPLPLGVQPPRPPRPPRSLLTSLRTALTLGVSIQDGLGSVLVLFDGGCRGPPLLFLLLPSSWLISPSYRSHRSLYPCRRG